MLKKVMLTSAAIVMFTATAVFAQQTETIEGGRTSVTLSGEFVSALQSLGVSPGTIAPTKLQNGKVTFPITGGAVDLKTFKGEIIHSGGLTLTAGSTQVRLQSFIIDTTGASPVLTGLVVVNGGLLARVPLFDINLAGANVKTTSELLNLSQVGLTLDAAAASALNQVFNVNALKAGFPIGTAKALAVLGDSNGKNKDDGR